jgi:hypothetical protein
MVQGLKARQGGRVACIVKRVTLGFKKKGIITFGPLSHIKLNLFLKMLRLCSCGWLEIEG